MRWPTCSRTTATPRSLARTIPWAYQRYSNFSVGMSKAWRVGGGQECPFGRAGSAGAACFPTPDASAWVGGQEHSRGIPRSFWNDRAGKRNVGLLTHAVDARPAGCVGRGAGSAETSRDLPPRPTCGFFTGLSGGRSDGRLPADLPRRKPRPTWPRPSRREVAGGSECSVTPATRAESPPLGTDPGPSAEDDPCAALVGPMLTLRHTGAPR
jgi:hypothetical protein